MAGPPPPPRKRNKVAQILKSKGGRVQRLPPPGEMDEETPASRARLKELADRRAGKYA